MVLLYLKAAPNCCEYSHWHCASKSAAHGTAYLKYDLKVTTRKIAVVQQPKTLR